MLHLLVVSKALVLDKELVKKKNSIFTNNKITFLVNFIILMQKYSFNKKS